MADFQFYLNRQGIRGLQGVKGDQGDSPIITVQTETPNEYILKITNPDGTELISPNLRGNKININEGTYVRYNTETGELYTSTADGATGELAGVVRLATDVDITDMDERSAVTPSQLADALSQYLVSPDGSVKIVQNAETSLTELTAKGGSSGNLPIASADTLGGVKIGENLSITEDGVLSSTASGDVSASGNNTFTGTNDFNGAVNLNGLTTAENLTVARNLTSSGEINAVSIKSTGVRSDDIKTTTNKKYLTEEDVDNQTIQIVEGKLHANLDELGNEVNTLSNNVNNLSVKVTDLSGRVTVTETDMLKKQNKLTAGSNITLTDNEDGTTTISATGSVSPTIELVDGGNARNVATGMSISTEAGLSTYSQETIRNGGDAVKAASIEKNYTVNNSVSEFDGIYSNFYSNSAYISDIYSSTETDCIFKVKFRLNNNAGSSQGVQMHIENVLNIENNGSTFFAYSWKDNASKAWNINNSSDSTIWRYIAVKVVNDTAAGTCTKYYYYSEGDEGFKIDDEHLKVSIVDTPATNDAMGAIGASLYGGTPNKCFRGSIDMKETCVRNVNDTDYIRRYYIRTELI